MLFKGKPLLNKTIIFLIIFIIGLFLYAQAFSNYQVSSSGTTGIIAGMSPADDNKMKVNSFEMNVNVEKQSILLDFFISYYARGNYTVAFTLPYRIASFRNLGSGTWYVRNAESGSAVMVVVEAENDSETGWITEMPHAMFYTEDKMCTSIFDTNNLNLAFGGSLTLDVNEKWEELREISWITTIGGGFNGTVQVHLPYSAVITGTSHQLERVDPTENYQSYKFRINRFIPLEIQFIDSSQRRDFETYLLISGTVFGVATAGFAEIAAEAINKKTNANTKKKGEEATEIKNQSSKQDAKKNDDKYSDKIVNLIEIVEKSFSKKKYLWKVTGERILTGLVPISAVIILTSWIFFIAFDIAMSYLSVAESKDAIVMIVSIVALTITLISFFMKLTSDLRSIFVELTDKEIAEWNFKKLKDNVELQDIPLLKALIIMKSMQPNIDLKQVYATNETMFAEKALLEKLYNQ